MENDNLMVGNNRMQSKIRCAHYDKCFFALKNLDPKISLRKSCQENTLLSLEDSDIKLLLYNDTG